MNDEKTHLRRYDQGFIPLVSLLFLSFLVGMFIFARYFPDRYYTTLQEDHEIEWAQALLYGSAAAVGLWHGIRARRFSDILVALFCLFLCGEEISWGQRLLGLSTHVYLMESNHQQELNFHNLVGASGQHIAINLVLIGYGLILPLANAMSWSRRLLDKMRLTAPPAFLVPWFVVGIVLMAWYPYRFTKQWVEMILASLFCICLALLSPSRRTWKGVAGALIAVALCSIALTRLSDHLGSREGPERVSYARRELEAMLSDILQGTAATPKLRATSFKHDRIWVLVERGYLDDPKLTAFRQTEAPTLPKQTTELRRQYAIDPWGTSYWLNASKQTDGSTRITVYSFGPNRRRDSDADMIRPTGDDIAVTGFLR